MAPAGRSDLASLESLATHLGHLDRDGALALVEQVRFDGADLQALITGLLGPALVEVGRQWASGEVGAAESLAAAAIVRAAIPRSLAKTAPGHRSVAVCCPPGEHHEIPAEMITELLRAEGWPAQHIGAGLTPEHLQGFLAKHQPAALLVSSTTSCGLAGAARIIEVAHANGVPVIVGGAAFGRDDLLALRLGAAAWAPTTREALEVLGALRHRAPSRRPGMVLSEEYLMFEAGLPEIRATAVTALRQMVSEDDTDGGVAIGERLELLLRHLGAAVLVDDGRLFLDFLSWRAVYYEHRRLPSDRLVNALTAVASALPPAFGRGRRFVQEGRQHLAWKKPGDESDIVWVPGTRPPSQPGVASGTADAPDSKAPSRAPEAGATRAPGRQQAGRVFADLLFVATTSCHAQYALISVAHADGRWSTLSHGVERQDVLGDSRLLALVASRADALEIPDLSRHPELGSGPLARGPLGIRFVYGVPLRTGQGVLLGVLGILDRRPRELSGRERQALTAIARQMAGQLVRWRRDHAEPAPAEPGERVLDYHRLDNNRRHGSPQECRPPLHIHREAGDELLRSHEVAVLFDVTDRTVINWAASKKLPSIRTAGGHLRFRGDDVLALLAGRPLGEVTA